MYYVESMKNVIGWITNTKDLCCTAPFYSERVKTHDRFLSYIAQTILWISFFKGLGSETGIFWFSLILSPLFRWATAALHFVNFGLKQGDQMSLSTNRPKGSPTHFWPKWIHNLTVKKVVQERRLVMQFSKDCPKKTAVQQEKIRPIWSHWLSSG
jgi:hypothetical protein